MKKETTKSSAKPNDIFMEARKVFSSSYVDLLKEKGHDILERGGAGSFLIDAEGMRYLDCYTSAGMFNLGRRNESVIVGFKKAIYETDQGNVPLPSQYKSMLAHKLSQFIPGNLDCLFYAVGRGDGIEAACKIARGFTGRPELVTVDGGYYGEDGFALTLSDRPGKEQFGKLIPGVKIVPLGDIDEARKAITSRTAAFIIEPIQVENHCRMAKDPGYYKQIRALCDAAGAKLIFDETQTNFGRTGTKFFFEQLDVMPDILTLGEALTSGLFPMTTVIFTPEIKEFFEDHPLIHICTFGGHDTGCAVAMAALDEYERLLPWNNAAKRGDSIMKELSALAAKHAGKIVSVAGKGLLLSIKLATEGMAKKFCSVARQGGMIVNTGRVDTMTVLIRPSLLINAEDAEGIVSIAAKTLDSL
jgi:acetylornithine/succinyldiaminopimelate/putrescine aminotransferase